MSTGVPAGTSRSRRRICSLRTRTQPFETASPTVPALSVPWIATGPPRAQPESTGEKLERPSAPGPKGPRALRR